MFTISDWVAFYGNVTKCQDYGEVVALPTTSQIDSFEKSTGFVLPKGYRDFILVFGPGDFASSLKIAAPGYGHTLDPDHDLERINRSFRFSDEQLNRLPDYMPALLKRCCCFGVIDGRDWVAWDLEDICASGGSEYAIYKITSGGATRVANSFKQLIEDVCDHLCTPSSHWDEEEMGPRLQFHPATYDPTKQSSS